MSNDDFESIDITSKTVNPVLVAIQKTQGLVAEVRINARQRKRWGYVRADVLEEWAIKNAHSVPLPLTSVPSDLASRQAFEDWIKGWRRLATIYFERPDTPHVHSFKNMWGHLLFAVYVDDVATDPAHGPGCAFYRKEACDACCVPSEPEMDGPPVTSASTETKTTTEGA